MTKAEEIVKGLSLGTCDLATFVLGASGIHGVLLGNMTPWALVYAIPATVTGFRALLKGQEHG